MPIRRYNTSNVISLGTKLGTGQAHTFIRQAIANGNLQYTTDVIKGFVRLDTIAGKVYGDSTLWWVIAAASDIGWGLQVPPDTVIKIPNIQQVEILLN
jgi:nucleoid-associated protein YgaU